MIANLAAAIGLALLLPVLTAGFGFAGGIFGSFGGWCIGIVSRASGSHLLGYMAIGAVIGVVTGIISGLLITSTASKSQPV